MLRGLTRFFILLLVLSGLGLGAFLYGQFLFERPGPSSHAVNIIIEPGSGLKIIAGELAHHGVIENPLVFIFGTRLFDKARALKAGEYAFPARVSARGAMEIIASGETIVRRLTVPEGITSLQAATIVNQAEGLKGSLATIPGEGRLLPETYHYSWGDSRYEIVARMEKDMAEVLSGLWPGRAKDLPFNTMREALVLASIVEKETALPEERPRIAGVFINRLKKAMRLQSDPTVVYGLAGARGDLGRALTRKDLETKTAYNTYQINGLPPGPICNPGRASLEAVLHPLATKELYFVADGTGGHAFAETLKAHNKNVARWRGSQNNPAKSP